MKNTCDAFGGFEAQFEQAVAHGACMRHAEIRAVNCHAFGVTQEAGNEAGGQAENLRLKRRTLKSDLPVHRYDISNLLYMNNCSGLFR